MDRGPWQATVHGVTYHFSAVITPPKTILDDHTLTLFQVLSGAGLGGTVAREGG